MKTAGEWLDSLENKAERYEMADKLEQIIICPNCEGHGWRSVGDRSYYDCPVCERRGRLVIDGDKTLALAPKPMPKSRTKVT